MRSNTGNEGTHPAYQPIQIRRKKLLVRRLARAWHDAMPRGLEKNYLLVLLRNGETVQELTGPITAIRCAEEEVLNDDSNEEPHDNLAVA